MESEEEFIEESVDDEGAQSEDSDVVDLTQPDSQPAVEVSSETIEESFQETLDIISAKKKTAKEGSMKKLLTVIRENYCPENVQQHTLELEDVCVRLLRKGTNAERILALNLACVAFVTTASIDIASFDTWKNALTALAKDDSVPVAVRNEAIATYGLVHFIADIDPTQEVEACDFIMQVARTKSAVALHSWALLASTFSLAHAIQQWRTHMPTFSKLLDEDNVDLKTAAGECIALLHEVVGEQDPSSLTLLEQDAVYLSSVKEKIKELSRRTSKRVAKKEKSVQKSSFRAIVATVLEGLGPSSSLKLPTGSISFDGWVDRIRLEAFRKILQSGLLPHLAMNPFLSEVFSFDASEISTQAGAHADSQSRYYRQLMDKLRCQSRQESRDNKAAKLQVE